MKKGKKELKTMKVCLVGSSGGHLTHLYMLKPIWKDMDRFWVTFDKIDANSILKDEKVYHCYYPTNRNIKNLIKNTFLAIKVLHKEKPDLIISSGAAVAVPFFWLGKLRGAKTTPKIYFLFLFSNFYKTFHYLNYFYYSSFLSNYHSL